MEYRGKSRQQKVKINHFSMFKLYFWLASHSHESKQLEKFNHLIAVRSAEVSSWSWHQDIYGDFAGSHVQYSRDLGVTRCCICYRHTAPLFRLALRWRKQYNQIFLQLKYFLGSARSVYTVHSLQSTHFWLFYQTWYWLMVAIHNPAAILHHFQSG